MSTPTNYATLQTEIANVLARSDLTSDIPTFIKYGEVDLNNRLRIRELISTTNINPSGTNSFVPLPTGFLELISFNDNYGSPLQEVGYEKIADLQYGSGSGTAEYFALGARIDFERPGDAAQNYPMRYYQRADVVNDNAISAAILLNYPNLYVYSALVHAEPFIGNDSRIMTWKAFYEGSVKEANNRSVQNNKKLRTDFYGQQFNIIRGS